MNLKFRVLTVFWVLFMGFFLLSSHSYAVEHIAKITGFKGEVIILSGKQFIDANVGQPLMHGDRIQTKEGSAEITFNDGAVMKIRKFTSTMIQEREVEKGFWVFKTKRLVRRVSVFVGSMWFKSGVSKRKNYIQTPTAVCGIRGTTIETVFDLVRLYVQDVEGTSDLEGAAAKVPNAMAIFQQMNPSLVANKSPAYKSLADAKAANDSTQALKSTAIALQALIDNPNIPEDEKEVLEAARDAILTGLGVITPGVKPTDDQIKDFLDSVSEDDAKLYQDLKARSPSQ